MIFFFFSSLSSRLDKSTEEHGGACEWRTFLKIAAILRLIASCPSWFHMTSRGVRDRLQAVNEEDDDTSGLGSKREGGTGEEGKLNMFVKL